MGRIRCPECEKTLRTETGLEWHLKRAHSETNRDDRGSRASMAQEVLEPTGRPIAESPSTRVEGTQPSDKKREVHISYVQAGS
jgi:hypothetical protein